MAVDADHYRFVAQAILSGHVVPVLGAGANLCDRGDGETWQIGRTLPSGRELSAVLARQYNTAGADPHDLLRVSQAAALQGGEGPFFLKLRRVFAPEEANAYEPTSLQRFLADLPAMRIARGMEPCPQLIVTTNYDDLLEQAFSDAGEPFDLVYYLAQGESIRSGGRRFQGSFVHIDPAGKRTVVRNPKKYVAVTPSARTVILKIHGSAREKASEDSWVITEDHYIDYLTRTNLSELFPVKLLEKLLSSNLLFLGYAMKDWNLRVLLHRIWLQRDSSWESWAVQLEADELDKKLWSERDVNIQIAPLKTYIAALRSSVETVEAGL